MSLYCLNEHGLGKIIGFSITVQTWHLVQCTQVYAHILTQRKYRELVEGRAPRRNMSLLAHLSLPPDSSYGSIQTFFPLLKQKIKVYLHYEEIYLISKK